MNNQKLSLGVALVAVIIAIGGYFYPSVSASVFGANATGPAHYQTESFWQGLQLGQRGSVISNALFGKCSLISNNFTVTASTSVAMDCAVTGATSADTVFGNFATSTASTAGPGWEVVGVSASSTAGYDTFRITNGTGATATIPASLASSTEYLNLR